MKNCTQVKLHHKEISRFNISVVSRDVHCLFKSVKHSPTSFLQPLSQPERWGKRKKWETGRKRGRKSVSKRERERWRLRQTVWLHRDLQHSASYDSGVRGYPHWWISGPSLVSLHKRKGVVFTPLVWKVYFRNPSCQHETVNLSQGRRVTSTNITLFFSSSSSRFYRPAKTSRDALSHSDASKGVITQQWRIRRYIQSVCIFPSETYIPRILTGFGRLQFAGCELCERTLVFCVYPLHTEQLIPRAVSLYPRVLSW